MEQKIKIEIVGIIDMDGFIQDNKVYFRGGVRSHVKGDK